MRELSPQMYGTWPMLDTFVASLHGSNSIPEQDNTEARLAESSFVNLVIAVHFVEYTAQQ